MNIFFAFVSYMLHQTCFRHTTTMPTFNGHSRRSLRAWICSPHGAGCSPVTVQEESEKMVHIERNIALKDTYSMDLRILSKEQSNE